MTTALITHQACLGHDPTPGHVESPDRLRSVLNALDAPEFASLVREAAPLANYDDIVAVHSAQMVQAVFDLVAELRDQHLYGQIDNDTFVSIGSKEAALRAAGAVTRAVDLVMSGAVNNAFCAVRPPGHHAEPDRPMGFCLFNNVAIGAFYAQQRYGLERVAVIDFDVHHGNGTQSSFEDQQGLFYLSSHQAPLYPGTGKASEHGRYNNVVNLPLPADSGSSEFRAVMTQVGLPALARFAPELVIISAGFDAHERDPLANLRLTEHDYAWITAKLIEIARASSSGRIVSVLEGGYDLTALAKSAAAHVAALMEGARP